MSLQYFSVLTKYNAVLTNHYSVLQKLLLRPKTDVRNDRSHPVLPPYYKVALRPCDLPKRRQNDLHPVLLPYYKSTSTHYRTTIRTTPILRCILEKNSPVLLPYCKVLLRTTKHYSDRNDVRTTSIQYCSVLKVTLRPCGPPKRCQNGRPSSTFSVLTKYSPVLLRDFSVLQSNYSSTIP